MIQLYKLKILIALVFVLTMHSKSILAQEIIVSPQIKGNLIRFSNFKSQYVDSRTIDVWLPENYKKSKKYAVLYMHDGQMLFDSTTTWNKQSWNVDEHISTLTKSKKIKDCIVVGIYNNGSKRHFEYTPQKALTEFLSKSDLDSIKNEIKATKAASANFEILFLADNYLKFLTTELKPFIDKEFSTLLGKENTSIMGSSMGGLISMYALCEYPEVFGNAACLSTHWPLLSRKDNPAPEAILKYLNKYIPAKELGNRIYFDCGTATLDALYPEFQARADQILKSKVYNNHSYKSMIFPGEEHTEKAWSKRLDIPLVFLLGKRK